MMKKERGKWLNEPTRV